MNVMVIGGGGREHAIVKKLRENPEITALYALPGNGGMAREAICVPIGATDLPAIAAFAKEKAIDYAVVTPDDPLVLGAVDLLEGQGVPCFGPNKAAAMLEGSKAFAKAHPDIKEKALVVNLDCVGNGDTYIFCGSAAAQEDPLYDALKEALERGGSFARFFPTGKASMNSDHKSFDKGVGVCACRHKPFIGYYNDRIHTARDTVADPQTVSRLAEALADFAKGI